MRRLRVVALLLLATGCSSGGSSEPVPSPVSVRSLCGLSELPRSSPEDLRDLRDRARSMLAQAKATSSAPSDSAVVQAATLISVQADLAARLASAPKGVQDSLAGVAGTLDDAVGALQDACS